MTPEDSSGSPTTGSGKDDLSEFADAATQRARSFAEEGKETAAQQIGGIATAIRGAAREFERQMPQGAEFIRGAAAKLESGADRLRQRSVDEWLQSANKFAHHEPVALFGGALLVGFALSRFLNSSRPTKRTGDNQR
jgi:hypothetical protein